MATQGTPLIPLGEAASNADVAVQRPWRMRGLLSRLADGAGRFLAAAAFDRAPWLAVGFGAGIGLWFLLVNPWQWIAALGSLVLTSLGAVAFWRDREDRTDLLVGVVATALAIAAGLVVVWSRSELIGAQPIEYPRTERFDARVLEREEQPAEKRVRLVLAVRDAATARALKVRVNVPQGKDATAIEEGARIRLRARLMPPAPPLLPGAYDFARAAWFQGLAATGSLVGEIELVEPAPVKGDLLARAQRDLSAHVRESLDGSSGAIAAAFASGDRGAILEADEIAMRDAGLTHLLSISGLHVSAVIAAAYFLSLKLLALWPWLVLRIRLPLVAAAIAAGAGIAYTLLTGAEVPTVRSCIGALLVLIALALGREPLSMRMVAVAAVVVLALWPEALIGPSFQMSFTAVIVIVALHNAEPVQRFLAPREEGWLRHIGRRVVMLFLTGVAIEIVLTPIVLFHFHRAGLYGAFANVLAIPLVTFVIMPLIALALLFDLVGLGAAFWWLAGHSLELLLGLARSVAEQPGAVRLVPQMDLPTVLLFVAGGLWLALWRGRARLAGLLPVSLAMALLAATSRPDVLIARDGRDVGIAGDLDRLLILRDGSSDYARENLLEMAAIEGEPQALAEWSGARCSEQFCVLNITRGNRDWILLIARNRDRIDERALAAACERSDIVVADRWLPRSCRPRWLKADRRLLDQSGGLAIYLGDKRIETVAEHQGNHGWWRPEPQWSPPSR